MTTTTPGAGDARFSTPSGQSRFYVADSESEQIAAALSALNAVSSLMAGVGLPYQLNNISSEDLVFLLDLIGKEIEDASERWSRREAAKKGMANDR